MLIPKVYSYLYDVVKQVERGDRISVDEFNIIGSRKSGKSISIHLLYGLLLHCFVKVGLFAFRASKDDLKELFDDFCATFDAFDIPYRVNWSKRIIYWKHNKIRFIGVNSMKKSQAKNAGMAKAGGVKYIFKFFEERYEFSSKDYQALQEAVRGINDTKDIQMITVNVCNPWAKSHYYVSYCGKYQQWNLNLLRETGSQIGVYKDFDKETGITVNKLFHYTNWRCIKELLSISEINEIRNTWNIDRNRAMTTDYGLPGYEVGAIYTHLLHKIGNPVYTDEPQHFIAGMDYGWSRREEGGKTACYFGTANSENGVDIHSEYVHDNATHPKGVEQVAREIVEFYMKSVRDYMDKQNMLVPPIVKVRVDNMNIAVIQILNNYAQQFRVNHWLSFIKCRKYPIQDRIELTIRLMDGQWLRINPNCVHLKSEFEMAQYEETETQKRMKKFDHSINAFEYAIEPVMYKLARELGLSKLAEKYSKEQRIW